MVSPASRSEFLVPLTEANLFCLKSFNMGIGEVLSSVIKKPYTDHSHLIDKCFAVAVLID